MNDKGAKGVYLDYAATTPLDPEVAKTMLRYMQEEFGNPSSLHLWGQRAQAAVDNARDRIARMLNASWQEIFFTGSATEADNIALRGIVAAYKGAQKPHIVTSLIEHKAILQTCKDLANRSLAEVTYVSPEADGIVNSAAVRKALKENTVLVSIMYANNEIGTLQPISEIAREVSAQKGDLPYPYFHTDAVQALNYLLCDVVDLGVDLMSLSAHKIYGPKGVGVLFIRKGVKISPWLTGGTQERGMRAGTENVAGIVGFAKALERAEEMRASESKRVRGLRDYMWQELQEHVPGVVLQGSLEHRLPNNLSVRFPKEAPENLLLLLADRGVGVSAGSACNSKVVESSHVVLALGASPEEARRTIRFSFGRGTEKEDIDYALETIKNILKV